MLKIAVSNKQDYALVHFNGEMDKIGLEAVRGQLNETVEKLEAGYLVFDLADLKFINSEGVGFLLTIHYRLIKRGKKLALMNASARVADVLDVIGILKLIPHYDSLKVFEATL